MPYPSHLILISLGAAAASVDVLLQFLRTVAAIGVALAVFVAGAILMLAVTYIAARLARGRLYRGLYRHGAPENVAILASRAIWIGVWALGVVLLLTVNGIGLAPVAAFIGVVGLAASLSLQTVLQNLVAGVYILAERPFRIGDTIAVVGPSGLNHVGKVEDIQMRTTHLRSADDELILVPNSAIFTGVVTNRTVVGGYATQVSVTFPRDTDPGAAQHDLLPLLRQVPAVLDRPSPVLRVDKVTGGDWTACLTFWVSSDRAASDAIWSIAHRFPQATVNAGGEGT